jgi:glucose-6-phosphate dehydrogenase assembly protein OpcA
MATPVENVANRAWRRSTAESIDDDLGALWRELAREAPVSRAVMSNLVVFSRSAAGDDVDLTPPPEGVPIDDVARNHPSRVILLHHDPNPPESDAAPEVPLTAHVGVLTFGPPEARYGVEQIVIHSGCTEAALPSIVRRLMLGDVPTSVWWTEDLSETHLLAPLVTMGRQLLYDSRRWGDVRAAVLALAPLLTDPFGPDLADVNWRRLLPVRQALVHAVGSREASRRQRLTSVRIHYRRGEAALAWLFAGWLQDAGSTGPGLHRAEAGRVLLDPTRSIPLRPDTSEISVDEDSNLVDDVLTASFDDGLHVRLDSHLVSIDDPFGPAPFAVAAPNETAAEAVAAELRVLTQDAALHHALAALVARFGRA